MRRSFTYYGISVELHGPNTMGMRWLASVSRGPTTKLRADTKEGMKELIREHVRKYGRE